MTTLKAGSLIAFKGATAYEAQVGRFWIRVLRPRFLNRRSWPRIVQIGVEKDD